MNLINQKQTFQQKMSEVEQLITPEVQLPGQVFTKNFLKFRVIDFDEIYSEAFFQSMNNLLKKQKNSKWTFAVLENNPQDFFYKLCKKYPIFEVTVNDNFRDYLSITRDELACIPNESLADNAYIVVIYPESLNWVIYGDFNYEIGVVGFLDNEKMENFISAYQVNRVFPIEEAIVELLEVIYPNGTIPENILNQLLHNYSR